MNHRAIVAVAAAALIPLALAGCAASTPPEATPTVTVTSTVTASPAPTSSARSADDALSELDAWLVCYGATFGLYSETSTIFPYSPGSPSGAATVTDNGDGTFEVLVPFAPSSGEGSGAESICVAGGTVGQPTVELRGGRDFG